MKAPEVLVVMPFYNERLFLRAAIESILEQTYPHFKLLVINDGSNDGSEQEAASIKDNRLIIWHQENQGLGPSVNHAIEYAIDQQIPFLARMDADDLSLPQRLETQIRLLEKYPDTAACSTNCHYIDAESGQIVGTSTVPASHSLIRWEITHGLRGLIHGACVFRTKSLSAAGGYRSKFKHAEDADLFLRLVELNELRNCSEFLYKIRIRTNSFSIQNVRQNVLYQFYALDCARIRYHGKPERDFDIFLKSLSWRTRFQIWREINVLNLWRTHINKRLLPAVLMAAFLDPRRILARGLRKLDEHNNQ